MSSRVIDLSQRFSRNGHANGHAPLILPARTGHLYEWDVDALTAFTLDERGPIPNHAQAGFRVYLDPRIPFYSVAIYRDGFDFPLILSSGYTPGEDREATVGRNAILWFINQCLSAAYRAPA